MRPCVECGYRSDPIASPQCPECGAKQLSPTFTVLLREPSPWFWRMAHLGSLTYIGLLAFWILATLAGQKPPTVASFIYLAIVCFPISIAHLRGKRLNDIWIISDTRLEHRPRVGGAVFFAAEDGWRPEPRKRYKRSAHLWLIQLRRPKGKWPRKAELLIDDRQDDPSAVEPLVAKTLTPRGA